MAAVGTVADTDATWHRLSPRMLLIHPVLELVRALPGLLGLFIAGHSSGHGVTWGLAGAAIVAAFALTRWFTTRLRVTAEQVQLRHGLLRRSTTAAPLDRVRTVDVTSHLLHRALGLARVVIGTGTSDRQGRGRLVLDGLTVEAAARLREDLLHSAPRPAEAGHAPAVAEYEIARLDPAWVRYAPFTLSGALTGLVLYGFAMRLQSEAHIDVLTSGPLRAVGDLLRHTQVAVSVALVAAAALLFVTVASTVGYVLAFWDFRLSRHLGGTLHVTRGLITSRATSIERRRLVGVELSEALVLRAVGGARCLAIATGLRVGRGAERGGEVLLPPAPRAVAVGVARAVLDGATPLLAPLLPHGPAARRRRLTRALAGALFVTGLLDAFVLLLDLNHVLVIVAAVPFAFAVPLALDRYRSLGHTLVDGYVVTRFGSLVRRHSAIAAEGVIGWNLSSTFFQRRAGLVTLTATTAAGRQGYAVPDVETAEALRLADAALPGLLTQFRG